MAKASAKSTELKVQVRDQLFARKTSKSEQTKLNIIEAAIRCYSQIGPENLSYEEVAKRTKLTRPLIQRYFPDREELFRHAMKLVRAKLLQLVLEEMTKATAPQEKLAAYVRACFLWVKQEPIHAKTWMLYFFFCTKNSELKKDHLEMTSAGARRIIDLLGELESARVIEKIENKLSVAKNIQKLITGAVVELVSELTAEDISRVCEETLQAVFTIIGLKGLKDL